MEKTLQELAEQIKAECSIRFTSVRFRVENGKAYYYSVKVPPGVKCCDADGHVHEIGDDFLANKMPNIDGTEVKMSEVNGVKSKIRDGKYTVNFN